MRSHPDAGHLQADAPQRYLAPLRSHAATVSKLFPGLGGRTPENGSISSADALFVGYFLEPRSGGGTVLEIGPGTGDSTLCLASHPKVSKVVSVNPNRPVAGGDDPGRPGTLDVARAVAEEHAEERKKIHFFESPANDIPAAAGKELDNGGPAVLVIGLRTRKEVAACLKAVFDRNPDAVVMLGGCRGDAGPFVQAGAVDFLDGAKEEYRFRLAGDLGPALAGSGFGILYSGHVAAGVEGTLQAVGRAFNLDLDPLKLLGRAEEQNEAVGELGRQRDNLAHRISRLEQETSERESRLEEQIAHLKNRNAALNARLSGRRYKAADAAADGLLRLPMVKKLLRGNAPPDKT